MLFKKNIQFLLQTEFGCYAASVVKNFSTSGIFFEVKHIKEVNKLEIGSSFNNLLKKNGKNFVRAYCSFAPLDKVVYKTKIDSNLKKNGLSSFPGLLKDKLGINLSKYNIGAINSQNGLEVKDKQIPDEVIFLGAAKKEIIDLQESLIKQMVYPEAISMASVDNIKGLIDYLEYKKIEAPVLCCDFSWNKSYVFIIRKGAIEAAYDIRNGLKHIIKIAQKENFLPDEKSGQDYIERVVANSEVANNLISRFVKEIKSYLGFYEVKTGRPIQFICNCNLPERLMWIEQTIAKSLNIDLLDKNYTELMESKSIKINQESVIDKCVSNILLSFYSLIVKYA